MVHPPFELADVFRLHLSSYREAHPLPLRESRVASAILSCRTAALGGHVYRCQSCSYETDISYNSCRNRHCPKCQGHARRLWVKEREKELLPVGYFHVVFTLPALLAELALFNKRRLYEILFQSASKTLLKIAADPKYLGGRIGFLAVLHTWGQTLVHHPHLHCVVPAGGISLDQTRWIPCKRTRKGKSFLLPVHVLSNLFQGLFLSALKKAFDAGRLVFPPSMAQLASTTAFEHFVSSLRSQEWVVYSKPPFGSPQKVLRYLGRYTHRVAISNARILSVDESSVTFTYKDYRDGNR